MRWVEYFATIRRKQLYGAEPVLAQFREFVTRFPSARSFREKVLLIDALIHSFHWNQKYGFTRPVAVNLIQGRLEEVITFLDRLSYGEGSTVGVQQTRLDWDQKSRYVRSWAFTKKDAECK